MHKRLVFLKRPFYFSLFFLLFFFSCLPFFAYSQQHILPFQPGEDVFAKQEETVKSSETIIPKNLEEEFPLPFPQYPFLSNFKKTIIPGHIKLDDTTLKSIHEYQLNNGIKNFTTVAIFLVNESQKSIRRGEASEAIRLAKAAKNMAPDFPQPSWALAQAYGAESRFNFFRVMGEYLEADLIALKNFKTLILIASNSYFLFFFAFFLTIIVFSFVLLIKYYNLLAKDSGDFFSQKTYSLPGYVWAGIIVILPVILGIGPILIACYWLVILALYASKKEKQAIFSIALLLVLSPLAFETAASMVLSNQEGILDSLYKANHEDWSQETEKKLEAYLKTHPRDLDVIFTLGLIKKKWGSLEEANRYYTTLLESNPSSGVAINNLSNVYFAQERLEQSEAAYKRAISIKNDQASFHYNLYRAYLELYKFLEARKREELAIARRLDPQLIDDHLKKIYSPATYNRMVIDETITSKEFWNRAFQDSEEKKMVVYSLWPLFFKGIPYAYGIFFFILLSLFIFVLLFQQEAGKNLSTRCQQCGRAMKRRRFLSKGEMISEFCSHCVDIYLQRVKLDANIKDRRIAEVEKHQKRQTLVWRFLTFALPGSGQLWLGFTGIGIGYVFIFFCFILKIFFWNGFVNDPFSLNYSGSFLEIIFFGFLFLLFYLFVKNKSYRKKELSDKNFMQIMEDFRTRSQKRKDQTEEQETSNNIKKETPWP
jgi:tetratricopeptide (TPR) repeat protein